MMARNRAAKRKRIARPFEAPIDATPERLAMCESEFVNPAEIDSSEQPIGRVRRLTHSTMLDRLHRNEKISYHQWFAGNWYRETHQRCGIALSVVASYGERTSAGECSYGLPRSEAQLRARRLMREARAQFPQATQGFMERFLIHDGLPRYGGNQYRKTLSEIRKALDDLAYWLRVQ